MSHLNLNAQTIRYLPAELYPMQSHHMKEIEANLPLRSEDGDSRLRAALLGTRVTFICFTNRVGSNYFTDMLDRAGFGVRVSEEDFNSVNVLQNSKKNSLHSFDEYLALMAERTKRNNTLFFKIGASQLLWIANRGFLSDYFSEAKFIYIRRRDKIAQAVSLFIMNKTGRHLATVPGFNSTDRLVFNEKEIARELKWIVDNESIFFYFFALHGINPLEVWYEDLVRSPSSCLIEVARYCGIEDRGWLDVTAAMRRDARVVKQATAKNSEFVKAMMLFFAFRASERL